MNIHTHIHAHTQTHTNAYTYPHTCIHKHMTFDLAQLWYFELQWTKINRDGFLQNLITRTTSLLHALTTSVFWSERRTQLAREPRTLDSVWVRTSAQWVHYITHKKYMRPCAPGYNWNKSLVETRISHFFNQTLRLLFFSLLIVVRLLFKGGYYSRAVTIRGRHLFHWKACRHQWLDKVRTSETVTIC